MACAWQKRIWQNRDGLARRLSAGWPRQAGFVRHVGRALLIVLALLVPATAATNQRIVADQHSGLALWGYDPVAYYLEGAARQGVAEFEANHDGLMWHFINAGNLEAFKERPDDYVPAFGGFDPTAAARKAAVPGNPEMFAVWNGKLLLFSNEAARERFFTDPGAIFHAAEAGWEDAAKTLPR
jgi:YHS domain-containing protein